MNNFKHKYGPWALVAGASEGLGAAFAESIAKEGLNLILIARREEKLKSISDMLQKKYGIEIMIYPLDLSQLDDLRSFLSRIKEEVGLFVYNAAFAPIGNFLTVEEKDLLRIADVNVKAPLILTRILSEKMITRKKGGIILMSSLSGFQGSPKISSYGASKAFNTVLAEGLWKEMKEYNIDVLACCAGAVRTPGYVKAQTLKEAPGTLDASIVAATALESLGKGPIVIPGKMNKIFHFLLSRLFTRKSAVNMMYKNTKDLT